MTYQEAKNKIMTNGLTREDVTNLRNELEFADWNIMRAVINDLATETLIDSVDTLHKKVEKLESNHIKHLQDEINQIKDYLGKND